MDRLSDLLAQLGPDSKPVEPQEAVSLALSFGIELQPELAVLAMNDLRAHKRVQDACSACTGLATCGQEDIPGWTTTIEPYIGGVSVRYRKCDKLVAAESARRLEELVRASDVPMKLREMSFKGFEVGDNAAAVGAARKLVKDRDCNGAVFFGPPGVGKTHLGMAVVNNRLILGSSALYVTVPQLFKSIGASYGGNTYDELMARLSAVDILMLDDLGVEKTSDIRQEELFLIVNTRVNNGKQMIVTTNLDRNGLQDRYGARIASRLVAACDWYEIKGTDRRISGGAQT